MTEERAANRAWILTGSLENFRVNVERGFDVIGIKDAPPQAGDGAEPGDEIVFYVTGVQAFGAISKVRSAMFEDRTPIGRRAPSESPRRTPGGWRPSP